MNANSLHCRGKLNDNARQTSLDTIIYGPNNRKILLQSDSFKGVIQIRPNIFFTVYTSGARFSKNLGTNLG